MIREFHGGFSPGEKKLEKFFSARRIIKFKAIEILRMS